MPDGGTLFFRFGDARSDAPKALPVTHIPNLQTLVLNADMQPLSWGPLSVWSWQDALVAVLQERVIPVINYDVEVTFHAARFPDPVRRRVEALS